MRGSICGVAAIIAALSLPGLSQAAVYKSDHCQVTVPDGWVASKSRIASPDKKRWATLLSAPTAAEIVKLEASMGAKPAGEVQGVTLLTTKASFGGLTNVAYIGVSKTAPACMAQVTSPAGPDEAGSKQIAVTVKPGG